ncbi:tetratricopeptide repeat protein [Variovorax soli]|uniref:Flp pilus assembly protein TadD n=1 Tax=Variovorax soli TaxID=376815 RepID=A0ABU1NIC5_9BURK|nr:tetratricopeptide repeat protein [Variovorax soli]MDR6537631.1 Flp pilus assembly protein TadD [Variovorax soli]
MKHTAAPSSSPIPRILSVLLLAFAAVAAHADDYLDVNTLLRQGKAAEALTKADAYIAGKPRDPQMRFLRGVILTEQGKQAEAVTAFTQLTQDFPELPEPYNNLAALYAAQSQFDKARAALEMAIKLNPNYATAHENLGDVYARLAGQSYGRAQQLEAANTSVAPKLALIRQLFSAPASGALPAAPADARKPVRR